jgi:hypothetical protein
MIVVNNGDFNYCTYRLDVHSMVWIFTSMTWNATRRWSNVGLYWVCTMGRYGLHLVTQRLCWTSSYHPLVPNIGVATTMTRRVLLVTVGSFMWPHQKPSITNDSCLIHQQLSMGLSIAQIPTNFLNIWSLQPLGISPTASSFQWLVFSSLGWQFFICFASKTAFCLHIFEEVNWKFRCVN